MPISPELASLVHKPLQPPLRRPLRRCRGAQPPAEGAPGYQEPVLQQGKQWGRVQSCLDHARDEADHKTIWLHPHLPTDGGLCPR